MTPGSTISHPVYARLYDRLNRRAEESIFPPHRAYLAADLRGRILDVGIGTGSMLPYYADARHRGDRFELRAIEPDSHMRRQAEQTAVAVGLTVDIDEARAEKLPYPDGTFDVVICSLVLCSVEDVGEALSEVERVLHDDGELRFFEHIQSEGLRGRLETLVSPVWRPIVAGCRIDRRTDDHIQDRFDVSDMEAFDIGTLAVFPVRRFVRGRVHKLSAPPG